MLRLLLLIICCFFSFSALSQTLIPDANFEQFLVDQGIDTNGLTGDILNADAAAVTALNVNRNDITDFTGLEAFINVVTLNLGQNQVATYPLSNLVLLEELNFARNTALTTLDLSQNLELRELVFNNDAAPPLLTTLDLSNNTKLENLNVRTVRSITSLILPVTATLTDIYVANLSVPTIDLSQLTGDLNFRIVGSDVFVTIIYPNLTTALKRLELSSINFPTVDVSSQVGLEYFGLSSTNTQEITLPSTSTLTTIIISGHELRPTASFASVPELTSLSVTNKRDAVPLEVDISQNLELTRLTLSRNNMVNLDVSQNTKLTNLDINTNDFTSIDVSQNLLLQDLDVSSNQLPVLDVQVNTALTRLEADNNLLPSIDVTQNTLLRYLYLGFNQLPNLDITQNTALWILAINNNLFTGSGLDLSQNIEMFSLNISNNQVETLDFSNTAMRSLDISYNIFPGNQVLNDFFDKVRLRRSLSDVVLRANNNLLTGLVPDFYSIYTNNDPNTIQHRRWWLHIENNNFHFGDFENEHLDYVALLTTQSIGPSPDVVMREYTYAPQEKVNAIETPTRNAGESITLVTEVRGSQNHYRWFKDGVAIPDAPDSPELILNDLNTCDSGVYHAEITSDLVPFENANAPGTNGKNLLLLRNDITLTVNAIRECVVLDMPLTNVPINSGLQWTDTPGACGYRISVGTTSGGTNVVNNEDVGEVTVYNFAADLNPNQDYFVTITPYYNDGDFTGCTEESFNTNSSTVLPDCTTLLSPLNGATDVAATITRIEWNPANGADQYNVTLSSPSGNNDISTTTTDTFLNLANSFNAGEVVTVLINPVNAVGTTDCNPGESFTIVSSGSVPPCIDEQLATPADGSTDVSVDTNIQWNAVAMADGYNISIGTTSGGTEILTPTDVGNVLLYDPVTDLPPGAQIFVTITPYNANGSPTACQEVVFTTAAAVVGPDAFVTTWRTDNPGTSNDDQITIPTTGGGYNYTVNWGDGNVTNEVGNATHTYASPGTYTVAITGDFPRIFFNNVGDRQKLLTIEQWGTITWTSMERAFHGCVNLTGNFTDAPDLSGVTNMSSMFDRCEIYNSDMNNWDVSTITNMTRTFANARAFNGDISLWNVGQVTRMDSMFLFASSFNVDIGNWNVSNVESMDSTFGAATVFNQDIGDWNLSSTQSTRNMFTGCQDFNQDISRWQMDNVVILSTMFQNTRDFNQEIGSWNLASATDLGSMFGGARAFNGDIGAWNVSNVTDFERVFNAALSFNQDISGWNTSSAENMSEMFSNAAAFDQDISSWNVSLVTNMENMFQDAGLSIANYEALLIGWNSQNLQSNVLFDGGNSTYCSQAAEDARANMIASDSWTITDAGRDNGGVCSVERPFITTWETTVANETITIPTRPFFDPYDYNVDWGDGFTDTNVTGDISHTYTTPGIHTVSITGTFPQIHFNGTAVDRDKILTIEQWGDIQWSALTQAFKGCSNLNITNPSIDVPDLSVVTNISEAFRDCTSFDGDITQWNVSNVTNMVFLFHTATSFNQDIGNWDVSNVTVMQRVFENASSFNQDIGGWDVSNVTDMAVMFAGASSFNQNIGGWNVSNVTDFNTMFAYATAFNQDIGLWNTTNATNMNQMFLGASSFNQDISYKPGMGIPSGDAWNTGNVPAMIVMFSNASAFNQDIGNWNTSSVTNMSSMFSGASAFDQDISAWDVSNVTDANQMFSGVTLSTTNYDALLIRWNAQNLQSNVPFSGGNSQYCDGATARANMIAADLWTITDGGTAAPQVDVLADQTHNNSYTLPVITGTQLTGNEAYYTGPNGTGTRYEIGDVINFPDFVGYPITLYIYDGSGTCSSETSFELTLTDTITTVPDCTNLIAPLNLDIDVPVTTDLTWEASNGADGYRLLVGTIPGSGSLFNGDVGNTTTFDLSNDLPENTEIFVLIQPYNASGDAVSCEEESFITGMIAADIPLCTSLSFPENGSIDVPVNTELRWSAVGNINGYIVHIGTTEGGNDIVDEDVGLTTSHSLGQDLPFGQEIFVTIIPYNDTAQAEGCESQSFTTVQEEEEIESLFGFSPDGDGNNDYWNINGIETYPNNTVMIFNRWGDMVFKIEGYDNNSNVFRGEANQLMGMGAGQLPEGTYFFQISIPTDHNLKTTQGYLILKR